MTTDEEALLIIQANIEGKQIQWRPIDSDQEWGLYCAKYAANWNFNEFDYRIMLEPRIWWLLLNGEVPSIFFSEESVMQYAKRHNCEAIEVVEVLKDDPS